MQISIWVAVILRNPILLHFMMSSGFLFEITVTEISYFKIERVIFQDTPLENS